ncbi:MAG: hypothetical protein J07HX5_00234 [halophilic archaeon J07HX5]|nr:MAG: hypothetical protein J07HX5_00234 [halophilic archaeon J07HX5]
MIQSPPQSRHVSKNLANRQLSRLAVYAAVIPLIIAVLTVPAMVGAFVLGIVSTVGISRGRNRLSQARNTTDSDSKTRSLSSDREVA